MTDETEAVELPEELEIELINQAEEQGVLPSELLESIILKQLHLAD